MAIGIRSCRALSLALAVAACASGGRAESVPALESARHTTERCPLPAAVVGYPLTVIALDGARVDTTWLAQWARAAAYRWQVPSSRRPQFSGYRRVTSRVLPDVPRWADDWTPAARHRAELVVTVDRTGAISEPTSRAVSGDGLFDRSLTTIINDPLPASPQLPLLPSAGPESARLLLRFGGEPEPGERAVVVRFARQQRPVRMSQRPFVVQSQARGSAVMKYDVAADGRVVRSSVQILEASDPTFAQAVEAGLYSARFTPAQGDCAAIRLTVVQSVGR